MQLGGGLAPFSKDYYINQPILYTYNTYHFISLLYKENSWGSLTTVNRSIGLSHNLDAKLTLNAGLMTLANEHSYCSVGAQCLPQATLKNALQWVSELPKLV